MKRLILLMLLIPLMILANPEREGTMVVKGVVVNQHNQPMPHAKVLVISSEGTVAKLSTDDQGKFTLNMNASEVKGDLTICVEYVSYEKEKMPLEWKSGEEQLVFKLKPGYQPIINPEPSIPSFSKSVKSNQDQRISVFIPY